MLVPGSEVATPCELLRGTPGRRCQEGCMSPGRPDGQCRRQRCPTEHAGGATVLGLDGIGAGLQDPQPCFLSQTTGLRGPQDQSNPTGMQAPQSGSLSEPGLLLTSSQVLQPARARHTALLVPSTLGSSAWLRDPPVSAGDPHWLRALGTLTSGSPCRDASCSEKGCQVGWPLQTACSPRPHSQTAKRDAAEGESAAGPGSHHHSRRAYDRGHHNSRPPASAIQSAPRETTELRNHSHRQLRQGA